MNLSLPKLELPVTLRQRIEAVPATVRGMFYMLVATIAFSIMSALVRYIAGDLHVFQVAFLRLATVVLLMAPWLFRRSFIAMLRTERFGMHLVRNLLQSIDMLCWVLAITLIPLAEATALTFAAPLFATLLAVLFLKEAIRWRRIAALLIGFAGVLIAVRPGFTELNLGVAAALVSTAFWAATMVTVKSLTRTETSLTITAWMTLLMLPMVLVPALPLWLWPTWEQLGWCALMGVLGTIGHLAFAQAFRLAEVGVTLPIDYLRLVWAFLLGFVMFGQLPNAWYLLGGTIIFASATFIGIREAQLARENPPPVAPQNVT